MARTDEAKGPLFRKRRLAWTRQRLMLGILSSGRVEAALCRHVAWRDKPAPIVAPEAEAELMRRAIYFRVVGYFEKSSNHMDF